MKKQEEKTSIAKQSSGITLTDVISTAIQIPGVKVSREMFLRETFKDKEKEEVEKIIEVGPINAGCDRKTLEKLANKFINERTLLSTGASFAAGLPGGLAMAATIPADLAQFYGVALRLAQELSYLYGEPDLWEGNKPDSEKVTNQLILYCGVMLGASGAAQTVRVLSSALAKQALKKIPQKALTKTFYYPIVKSIAKAFGAKMTKEVFAKGVSKVVPIIGGVVSGGITFATLKPMGKRLQSTLDSAHFDYTEKDFESDWKVIVEDNEKAEREEKAAEKTDSAETVKTNEIDEKNTDDTSADTKDVFKEIEKAKKLYDAGIISEEEFIKIKTKLIEEM